MDEPKQIVAAGYDAVGSGATRWLLIRGRGERPLAARIDPAAISAHGSSKRPSVERGDLAILYAAVWQALYGVVEVVGDPENDPTRDRWSWRFAIRPLAVVADLHDAPPVEAAGVFPQSIWRHSHIRLTEEQFSEARRLVEAAAGSFLPLQQTVARAEGARLNRAAREPSA